MIAVLFEVEMDPESKPQYLDIAARLLPELQKIDGFISIERFQSLVNDNKLLSLSFFRDEAAIQEWRNLQSHRSAQTKGRSEVFSDYRIRIAHVLRDYGLNEREQAPVDSRSAHNSSSR